MPARTSDVIIIGGGIFGLMTALALSDAGMSVIILEKRGIWTEASAANAGSLGVQNKLPELVEYSLASWELWRKVPQRLGADIGLSQPGGIKVAFSESEASRLEANLELQRAHGLRAQKLTRGELRRFAPWLSPNCVAASFSPDDGFATPTLVGPALIKAVEAAGVTILESVTVKAISALDDVFVETDSGLFTARQIAITSGAWSSEVASMIGLSLPISLDVNMVTVTEPTEPFIPNIVTHARGILTVKQAHNGTCLIGGGWQGVGTLADRRKDVSYDQLVHNMRLAIAVIPSLGKLNVLRCWAGYEGVTPDSLPILGQLGDYSNVFCAACARGGFTLAPILSKLLSELMLSGNTSLSIRAFDPGRFAKTI